MRDPSGNKGFDKTSVDHKFNQLWTSCVGQPGYIKSAWSTLDVKMFEAQTEKECAAVLQAAIALKKKQLKLP